MCEGVCVGVCVGVYVGVCVCRLGMCVTTERILRHFKVCMLFVFSHFVPNCSIQ